MVYIVGRLNIAKGVEISVFTNLQEITGEVDPCQEVGAVFIHKAAQADRLSADQYDPIYKQTLYLIHYLGRFRDILPSPIWVINYSPEKKHPA